MAGIIPFLLKPTWINVVAPARNRSLLTPFPGGSGIPLSSPALILTTWHHGDLALCVPLAAGELLERRRRVSC